MPLEATAPAPPPEGDLPAAGGAPVADRGWLSPDAPLDVGLAGLRTHLARIVETLGLRSLTVVVDDPDLGRQAFRAGAGSVEPGVVAAGPGCSSDPPLPRERIDADLLVALCAASLRVDVLRGTTDDSSEVAVRRLPGVYAVMLERDGDLTVCRLLATTEAPDDIARQAAAALAPEARLVVELVRDSAPPPPPEPPAPEVPPAAEAEVEGPAAETPAESDLDRPHHVGPELLSVRSVPEEGEIEVHLAFGPARAIGRAPLSRGLAGAAEAVLAGVVQVEPLPVWAASWVRTVETTAAGSFVVAVALAEQGTGAPRHRGRHLAARGRGACDRHRVDRLMPRDARRQWARLVTSAAILRLTPAGIAPDTAAATLLIGPGTQTARPLS